MTMSNGHQTKVSFRGVSMSFGAMNVLNDINLDVADGEFLCIFGASGCG